MPLVNGIPTIGFGTSDRTGEDDMRAILGAGFDVVVETRDLPEQRRHGYGGIILARANSSRSFPES